MGGVILLSAGTIELPARNANNRISKKAKNLATIRNQFIKITDYVHDIDVALLISIPLHDSSTLRLYNALVESLELDSKRILTEIGE